MTPKEFEGSCVVAYRVRHQTSHQVPIIARKMSEHCQSSAQILKRRTVRLGLKRERCQHLLIHLMQDLRQKLLTRLEVIMKHSEVHTRTVGELTDGKASATSFRQHFASGGNKNLVDIATWPSHIVFIQVYSYTL